MNSTHTAIQLSLFALLWAAITVMAGLCLRAQSGRPTRRRIVWATAAVLATVLLAASIALGLPWESLWISAPPVYVLAWWQAKQTQWCPRCDAYHPGNTRFFRVANCRHCGQPIKKELYKS